MKERRTYRRTTLYPEKLKVGLTHEQDKLITAIADRDGESRANVVRRCIDQHITQIADRRRKRAK